MMFNALKNFTLLASLLLFFNIAFADVIYVAFDASGANDGTSWGDAFNDLQDAIDAADPTDGIDEIWVKAGSYQPTKDVDGLPAGFDPALGINVETADLTFYITDAVEIYGGFSGTETTRGERDFVANVTILEGDFTSGIGDNVNHVIQMYRTDGTAVENVVIDGFTIQNGTDRTGLGGGGIFVANAEPLTLANLNINNCTSTGNGGGLRVLSTIVLNLQDVVIEECSGESGGGMQIEGSSSRTSILEADGLILRSNTALNKGGGAYLYFMSTCILTNVLVVNNSAENNGGGIDTRARNTSDPYNIFISHGTFYGNTSVNGYGGAMYTEVSAEVQTYNSIFYGNSDQTGSTTVTSQVARVSNCITDFAFSLIQGSGGSTGWTLTAEDDLGNNIDEDPLFADPAGADGTLGTADDDFTLTLFSPAINVGTASIPNLVGYPSFDINGDARIQSTIPDLGPFETVYGTNFPVEWLSFEGQISQLNQSTVALLEWETATEIQSSHFVVERMIEHERVWTAQGEVQAAGFSQDVQAYRFTDRNLTGLASGAQLYYRLRQLDMDGSYSYSEVLSLTLENAQPINMTIAPNPAVDFATLNLDFPTVPAYCAIKLIDLRGVAAWSQQLDPAHSLQVPLPVDQLTPGIYVVEIQYDNYVKTQKIRVGF